jgi:hypothetical protein
VDDDTPSERKERRKEMERQKTNSMGQMTTAKSRPKTTAAAPPALFKLLADVVYI